MFLVGPGLVAPSRLSEYWLYFFSLLVGGFFLMHLIASLTARHVSALSGSQGEYKKRMQDLEKYMDYHRFNPDHRQRMRVYYELKYPGGQCFGLTCRSNRRTRCVAPSHAALVHRRRGHPSRPLAPAAGGDTSAHVQRALGQDAGKPALPSLPPATSISSQLVLNGAHPHIQLLRQIPMQTRLACNLAVRLKRCVFLNGDLLINQGTEPDGMFFLTSGELEIVKRIELPNELDMYSVATSSSSSRPHSHRSLIASTHRTSRLFPPSPQLQSHPLQG